MTGRERPKDLAIYETLSKMATGEWALTPAQREAVARWPLELKAAHPSTGPVKHALKNLLRVVRISGVPPDALALVQETITVLRELEPGVPGEKLSVPEALASIAKRQTDQVVHLDLMEQRIGRLLARAPPLPRVEELTTKAVERAQRLIKEAVQSDREDATTATIRRRFEEELRRAKTR